MRTGIVILLLFCCGACKFQTTKTTREGGQVFYPLKNTNVVGDMVSLVDSIEIVELEQTEESLISYVYKMLLTENGDMIIQSNNKVLLFDASGKYLRSYGAVGRGPEEYVAVRDICLSRDNKNVVILDPYNNIVSYRLVDGSFVGRVPITPPEEYPDYDAICPSLNGYYLFACNPIKAENFKDAFFCLMEYTHKGELINKFLPRKDYVFSMKQITQSYDKTYIIRPQEGDKVCFKTTGGEVAEWLTIDFEDKHIPLHYILPHEGENFNIQEYMFSDYYKLPLDIHDTQDQLYFRCCGPRGEECYFLYSIDNQKSPVSWSHDSNTDGELFQIIASDADFFYGIYDDYEEYDMEQVSKLKNSLKKAILKKTQLSLGEEQNPVVVKIKFDY